MYLAFTNRYIIAANFQKRATDFSFPAEVWSVAAALSEHGKSTSTSELESITGLGSGQVREAIERLLAKNLVREDVMSWKDFTTAKKRDSGSAKVATVAAKSAGPQTHPTAESAVSNKHLSAQNGVALSLGSITPLKSTASSGSAWIAQKPDPERVASFKPANHVSKPNGGQSNGRLLLPMLEQIGKLKGGGVEGQLLVYQVFLRVPYELLCAEGIKSLHFVDDQTMIHNPELLAAIVKAVKDAIGIDLV